MSIGKLLVANRGEIAARVMRAAHALGISTVAVFSDPDADAPYVALADEAVRLPGTTAADTYLRGDLVLAAAAATGADAIHPGYGFLSENAGFARACAAAGVTFVGPSPDAIAAMGSKVEAKALMEAAGVPVLPGATITPGTDLAASAEQIGFPVLVKAAFGGGGRGMRVVHDVAGLAEAVEGARREAAAAFGDGTVFLERFVVDPRHVEVQIVGDTHGTVVHLFERECSIQRRYQKIVEECPSPAVDDALRAELGAAAVAAGKALGYTGVGTVEFVLDAHGSFHFLEVNTRLQVEHPVTELVTGLDLVEVQLRVAEGAPLAESVTGARIDGHAIEARLYAEAATLVDGQPAFLPSTGTLHRFRIADAPGVRVDSGVADGSVVGTAYDPMLAKVIAHGPTRADAARRLARALRGAELHGVTTNRDVLVAILEEKEFRAGVTDTGYLGRHPEVMAAAPTPAAVRAHAVAAALARQAANRAAAPVLGTLPSGWRNVVSAPQRAVYAVGEAIVEVGYRLMPAGLTATVGGEPFDAGLLAAAPDAVTLEVVGEPVAAARSDVAHAPAPVRRSYAVHRVDRVAYVDGPDGSSALAEVPRFADPNAVAQAGSLLAPMPGGVVRVLVAPGAAVTAGQALVVLEAMKMEHTVAAPVDGTVTEIRVAPGDQVDNGQVLVVVEGATA